MKKMTLTLALYCGTVLAVPQTATAAECQPADCAAMGYSKETAENCKTYLTCPFDSSYKACIAYNETDTCGDKFYGVDTCPQNAVCEKCQIGNRTFIKTITCQNSVFIPESWNCVKDTCPEGYAFKVADCGKTGNQGWTLGTSTTPSTAGNTCSRCVAKTCSTTEYPYTQCTNLQCGVCYPGDGTPRYRCGDTTVYYSNRCLFVLVKNGVWQSDFPSICCEYKGSNFNGSCYLLEGKPISSYPVSNVKISCGSLVQKDSANIYYDYN